MSLFAVPSILIQVLKFSTPLSIQLANSIAPLVHAATRLLCLGYSVTPSMDGTPDSIED